ncbi:glycerol-3-phosphate responsive antiterminator [Bacillus salacetis]|uniref:Glycerol uptake operon antiterminator regulatory protein n=1 Tax=Bacillus salacetis TaxID=2315464 RepID=A0A3A1QYL8_9BACI|nr:glycerol-3-phosphate responsive antiterminator [Bacillus salacetis]RIW32484.1 glycerol-3-phosphate responsive antiterminator [Bacillus salacetis]
MPELSGILPAVKSMKEFDKLLESDHKYIILLETRLSQLPSMASYARKANKKLIVHVDLVQGLKTDEYGMEFLIRVIKVDGIISTRGNAIAIAKKNNLIAIQRLFLLDSHALEHNLKIINNVQPDYIEVLPGLIPKIIQEVNRATNIPVIAGGLIRNEEDIEAAYEGGAIAVTTSNHSLVWE